MQTQQNFQSRKLVNCGLPLITYHAFLVPRGSVYEELFCYQPKFIKFIEKQCCCTIKVSNPMKMNGIVNNSACLVEVNYDLEHERHNAFVQLLERIGRLRKGCDHSYPSYQVIKTAAL